jgi:hypothetical protein
VRTNILSRKLLNINKLGISMVVFFPSDRNTVYTKEFKEDQSKSVYLNFVPFVRIDFPYLENVVVKRNINLSYMGKIQMVASLDRMMKNIATKEMFTEDDELGLIVTRDLDDEGRSKWSVYERINEMTVGIHPTVIHEETTSYPGIMIELTGSINHVELTLSEFVALRNFLNDLDLWSLSQAMFNTAYLMGLDEGFTTNANEPQAIAPYQLENQISEREADSDARRKIDEIQAKRLEEKLKRKELAHPGGKATKGDGG